MGFRWEITDSGDVDTVGTESYRKSFDERQSLASSLRSGQSLLLGDCEIDVAPLVVVATRNRSEDNTDCHGRRFQYPVDRVDVDAGYLRP